MNKAEELKQKAKHGEHYYVFTEEQLEQYAQQESREKAILFGKLVIVAYRKEHEVEEMYDDMENVTIKTNSDES